MTFGLVITTYNEHRRPGMLERACAIASRDPRIGELVLSDDSEPNSPGQSYFREAAERIRRMVPDRVQMAINANPKNLGVFGAKLTAIRLARSEWIQSLDSDNVIDGKYIDTLFSIRWLPHQVVSPSFARPEFDYRAQAGNTLAWSRLDAFFQWNRSCCLLNTGNQFMHRETMMAVFEDFPTENFQLRQPDYFSRRNALAERHWRLVYDAADSFFFNKRWLLAGNEIYIAPGLEYHHEVHSGSSWKAAPNEKDILPVIYAMELLDRARGERADYLFDAVGSARSVHPPLGIPPQTKVAVLRRMIAGQLFRIWVSVAEPRILRSIKL